MYHENFDLCNIVTPIKIANFGRLLRETEYAPEKTEFIEKSFTHGFEIGYMGSRDVMMTAHNLKLRCGSKLILWNKIMKEVKLKRYAGPFENIPFNNYIQSPIGLVPKDGGQDVRLIFHLSYPRLKVTDDQRSLNANTPHDLCTVSYADFDQAVRLCIQMGDGCKIGKTDVKSAFRNLCIRPEDWMLLIMKAESPIDGKIYYFVDKCLPFGASISCSHFQAVSDAIAHIFRMTTGNPTLNYLDDYFFVAILKSMVDADIRRFLDICLEVGMPISPEKTFWGTTKLIFLGLLIDTCRRMVFIPTEKVQKAIFMVTDMLQRPSKKTTLRELQSLCGTLNFFGRCIIPARTFTRRLYAKTANKNLKAHHHIRIDSEMRLDLEMWLRFLQHPRVFSRSFSEFKEVTAEDINMYSDSSRNKNLGCGGVCDRDWFMTAWDPQFIEEFEPSINYLELYAVTVAVCNWIHRFEGRTVSLFCDNMSVVHMLRTKTSSCKNCMVLIRFIVLQELMNNVRVTAKHVTSKDNLISDLLSRKKYKQFRRITGTQYNIMPTEIPVELWPMQKIWLK